MASAEAVARYLLHLAQQAEEPCPITHLQLHKLLYYVQGWHLAHRAGPLFEAEFQAWADGPVVAELHPTFAGWGRAAIRESEARVDPELTADEREMIEYAWRTYGEYSALRLRAMTQREAPWREARGDLPAGAPGGAVISQESMRRHFWGVYERYCRRWGTSVGEIEQALRDVRSGNVTELELPSRRRQAGTARGQGRALAG